MRLSLQAVSFKEFSRIVYVFHCSVIKVLICLLSCDSLFTISLSKPFVNNFFSTFFISFSRFCCDSVAFCDSSYRIPLYFRNVNNKFRFFAKTLTILFAADTSPLKSLNLCSTKQESPHTSEVFSREFPAAYHTT